MDDETADRLRAALFDAGLETGRIMAERDRLRAVVDAAREFMAAFMAWRETVEDGKLPPLPVWGDDEERRRTVSIAALADALSQLDVSPTGEDT